MCREGFSILIERPAFVGRIAYLMVREATLVFREKGEVEKVRVEGALPLVGSTIGYHYTVIRKTQPFKSTRTLKYSHPRAQNTIYSCHESLKPPNTKIAG